MIHTRSAFIQTLFICIVLTVLGAPLQAEELDILNRPVNISGLTGLLFTTAPYALPKGTVELGASIVHESSDIPNYAITEFPFSITAGLPHNAELALRASYFNIKNSSTASGTVERTKKTGNLELSYKWNFLLQPEDSIRPAFALIVTGIIPTENNDMKTNAVSQWGMRLGISAGTEINWKDHILGIYADAQVQGQDLNEKNNDDIYEIYNVGLLLPISKHRNLQMFMEYSLVQGRNRMALDRGDYSGFTYGVRLVGERFNLTIGTQFLRKEAIGYDNSERLIGLMSMKF